MTTEQVALKSARKTGWTDAGDCFLEGDTEAWGVTPDQAEPVGLPVPKELPLPCTLTALPPVSA